MADKNLFERYLLALRRKPVDEKTEHTDRGGLQLAVAPVLELQQS